MAEVRIESVWKKFGGVTAVRDVSLSFPDGTFVVLVGPSGCGKTTLLRLLAGLEQVTDGRILIGGNDVTQQHPRERDIAMVFQSYALYPHMSVRRNMSFALELRNIASSEIERRVSLASDILGIGGLLDRQPRQLSGGQRQRVALGRAIVREPAVFLFDEPLSNLDAKLRTAMRSELIKLHKRLKTTIVYVTHDQVEAMTMGQIVVVMKDGIVQQSGAPLDIYHDPNNVFVAEFIGSPAMNFLEGEYDDAAGEAVIGGGALRLKLNDQSIAALRQRGQGPLVIGVRPEHLAFNPKDDEHRLSTRFAATVEVVEPLGAETIVEVSCSQRTLTARLKGEIVPRIGDAVHFAVDPAHLYIFEKATGERIRAADQRREAQPVARTAATRRGAGPVFA